MKNLRAEYRAVFTRERRRSLYLAVFIFALSLIFQHYTAIYSTRRATQFVGDIFLDNFPVINLNPIIVEGALMAIVLSAILILVRPKYIIFSIKAAAIFIAFRAFFVAATHLGIYPGQIVPSQSFFDQLYVSLGLEAGYFFSAHTGLPFLMALIFWREKFWRFLYLGLSFVFGISVLLAHVHYSIDVFAAPFMTYSIFKMAEYLFAEDYRLIKALDC